MKKFDLVILGSGSAAFAAAIKASELGARAAMTEHDTIGGTCVNRGCIPSKNLIAAAELYHRSKHSPFSGLSPAAKGLDFARLIAQKDLLVGELREKKYIDIAQADPNIEIVQGEARFLSPEKVQVGEETLQAQKFLIATGGRPYIPPFPGLERVSYLTSRQAFELEALPETLVIIGGGYIALELGQMFQRLGTQVTILERSPRLLKDFEPEISITIERILREEGVQIETSTQAVQVQQRGDEAVVIADRRDQKVEFRGKYLLLAVGRAPNTENLGLELAEVQRDERGFVRVDESLRTTAPHIWAAGDVTGPPMATPVGAREGVIAALNAINGAKRKMDYTAIPRAIFTDPEVASVGLTDEAAVEAGYSCRCQVLELVHVPKAAAIRDTRGLVKMVTERDSHRILGVHLVANRGADIIHEAALAVKLRLTYEELIETIHVYPTMSEAIRMAAQTFVKDVTRLSCCAE